MKVFSNKSVLFALLQLFISDTVQARNNRLTACKAPEKAFSRRRIGQASWCTPQVSEDKFTIKFICESVITFIYHYGFNAILADFTNFNNRVVHHFYLYASCRDDVSGAAIGHTNMRFTLPANQKSKGIFPSTIPACDFQHGMALTLYLYEMSYDDIKLCEKNPIKPVV